MRRSGRIIVNVAARHLEPDTVIDQSDAGGLGLAALALTTALLAHDVRHGRISRTDMRSIYNDARALIHDPAGFVVDPNVAQAADDFLSVSDALVQPDAMAASSHERRGAG
jgi:hypothetical protein